jgi:phospholipid/cholesterol/gamma-HCH transport system permease protein
MPFTVNLVAISMLREMGVLITAVMASGRSCSAFAAQIGVMQMNDEVAALRTLGLDPFELLVLPRVLGILIALPALTVVSDIAGLFGTYFVATAYLHMSYEQFMSRLQPAISDMTIYIGLIKAPVFAIVISVIGCFHGMQVRSSATELGQRTTTAVVQSIFLVVVIDALFSVIFTLMGL